MKKRKIGTAITIVFVSAIAATSGTLAWFSTVRSATINYNEAKILTTDSSLLVDYKSSLNTMATPTKQALTDTTIITIASPQVVTDVSGNGLNLYRPMWAQTSVSASSIQTIATSGAAGVADGYYIDFTVTFSRSSMDSSGMKVFLGPDTKIAPKNSATAEDAGIVKAVRMAVINYSDGSIDTGTPRLNFLYATEAVADPKYIEADGASSAYGVAGYKVTSGVSLITGTLTQKYTIATAEAVAPAIADLFGTGPTDGVEDVTFRFFVEGEDPHAVDANLGGVFTIDLDIYTLSE